MQAAIECPVRCLVVLTAIALFIGSTSCHRKSESLRTVQVDSTTNNSTPKGIRIPRPSDIPDQFSRGEIAPFDTMAMSFKEAAGRTPLFLTDLERYRELYDDLSHDKMCDT